MMTPRAVELWSYLVGLGPVGEPIYANPYWIAEDIGIRKHNHLSGLMTQLVRDKAIKRLGGRTIVVLKRPPAEKEWEKRKVVSMPAKKEFHELSDYEKHRRISGRELWERKRQEYLQAIESIPADTRNLTQRLLGDPLPTRSAYDKARMQANV